MSRPLPDGREAGPLEPAVGRVDGSDDLADDTPTLVPGFVGDPLSTAEVPRPAILPAGSMVFGEEGEPWPLLAVVGGFVAEPNAVGRANILVDGRADVDEPLEDEDVTAVAGAVVTVDAG